MEETYRKQVELLIRCLPEIEKQTCFALKGGTAINLFVRDMPRLSVDIDLMYLPVEPREQTLGNIESALGDIAGNIERYITGSVINKVFDKSRTVKLLVRHNGVQIKIEPNIVQRGSFFPIESHQLCQRAVDEFELSVTTNTISMAELYGSKITAALDRQHPRDLFDVKLLFENEGLTKDIRKAFVVYLASHPRPMGELLNPNEKDIAQEFETQFHGMANVPVELDDLLAARVELIKSINEGLTDNQREFLLSLKKGEPVWSLMDITGIEKLPAIQWKLQNIKKMDGKKHKEAYEKLESILKR
jgi:hypothetical protein